MIAKMIALDWRAMKVYQKRFPLLPLFAFVIGIYSPLLVIPICVIMCLTFSINPFAVEEKGDLNKLYLTLPIKRKEIVAGRYVLSLTMLLCGIIMGVAIMPLSNILSLSKWYLGIDWYIVVLAFSYLIYAVFNLSMFPMLFKLGYAKGKFWGFYLPFVFFGILFGAYTIIESLSGGNAANRFLTFASENMLLVSGGMALLAIVIHLLSYMTSSRLYEKRDF